MHKTAADLRQRARGQQVLGSHNLHQGKAEKLRRWAKRQKDYMHLRARNLFILSYWLGFFMDDSLFS